jgi:hypothetical protein
MIRTIILALPFALLAGAATAHTKTEGTTPGDGAIVAKVEMLHIASDAPMRVISVTLTRDGAEVAIERETGLEPVDAFHAVPAAPLAPAAAAVARIPIATGATPCWSCRTSRSRSPSSPTILAAGFCTVTCSTTRHREC